MVCQKWSSYATNVVRIANHYVVCAKCRKTFFHRIRSFPQCKEKQVPLTQRFWYLLLVLSHTNSHTLKIHEILLSVTWHMLFSGSLTLFGGSHNTLFLAHKLDDVPVFTQINVEAEIIH